jgi:hypothetical protein
MGNWAVIVQYFESGGGRCGGGLICRGRATKDQALDELRAVLHTYVPTKGIIEERRQVYRFADQESYLVVIKGQVTMWECTLRVAELVSDSADPAVAERARLEGSAGHGD